MTTNSKKPALNIDTNVTLPPAVKRQAKQAQELFDAAKAAKDGPPAEPAVPVAPIEQPDPPAEPAAAAPVEAPTPPGDSPPAPAAPAPAPQNIDWEHRYKSMEGRYKRDVPALNGKIAELEAMVTDLQQRQRAAPQEDLTSFERLVTDQERADYGPELLDVVGKRAKEEFNPLVKTLQRELAELKNQLSVTTRETVKSARQNMFDTLDQQVPEWRQLDTDPKFLEWLALPDEYSNATRVDLLNEANRRNDTPRVLAFFRGFLASEAARSPASAEFEPAPAPASKAAPAPQKVQLETLAAPGRAKSTASTSLPVEKPIITRAQITSFYAAKAAGRYSAEEADRFEKAIWSAQAEGRIQ